MTESRLPHPLKPMTVGSIVSAGFKLYRDRIRRYLQLACLAYLWVLVPVYGWAQFCTISATISRLAYRDLIHHPESVDTAKRALEPRLWSFLGLSVVIGLMFSGVYFGLMLIGIVIATLVGLAIGGLTSLIFGSEVGTVVGVILGTLIWLSIFLFGIVWFASRWFIAEMPLAIEQGATLGDGISRSWELTQASVMRVQFVVVVAFLVSLPILAITNYGPSVLLLFVEPGSLSYWVLYGLSLILSLLGGIVVLPFWQSVKAVMYYDLRTRRDGLDFQLRDRSYPSETSPPDAQPTDSFPNDPLP